MYANYGKYTIRSLFHNNSIEGEIHNKKRLNFKCLEIPLQTKNKLHLIRQFSDTIKIYKPISKCQKY